MARILAWASACQRRDGGATAVEYALMVGFIAVVIAGTVYLIGQRTVQLFLPMLSAW